MLQKHIKNTALSLLLSVMLIAGASPVMAWAGPGGAPSGTTNIPAPLNTLSALQTKAGPLVLNADLTQEYPIGLNLFGKIQIRGGSPAIGKLLTVVDADGTAEWQDARPVIVKTGTLTCPNGSTFEEDYWTFVARPGGFRSGWRAVFHEGRGAFCAPEVTFSGEAFTEVPHILLTVQGKTYSNDCQGDAFIFDIDVAAKSTTGFSTQLVGESGGCGAEGANLTEVGWIAIGS